MQMYQEIASLIAARANCKRSNNVEWYDKHSARLANLMSSAPSGAGIDCGTKLDDDSTPEKLVFNASYHHMNEVGMYDGWTQHRIIVTGSLVSGIVTRITGRDRNQIKDYLHEVYHAWLTQEVEAQ